MRLRHELAYHSPPGDVLTMLADPLLSDSVGDATGALRSTATVATEGASTRVVADREQRVAAAWTAGDRA